MNKGRKEKKRKDTKEGCQGRMLKKDTKEGSMLI